jgi:hypothetical protein
MFLNFSLLHQHTDLIFSDNKLIPFGHVGCFVGLPAPRGVNAFPVAEFNEFYDFRHNG